MVFRAVTGGGGAAGAAGSISAGTAVATLGQVVFADSNGITFGIDGQTLTGSVGAAGGGLTNINVSAGITSNNLSNIVFANANGVSFGLNASTVTATVVTTYLTSQSNQNVTAENGGFAFQTLSFSNANGFSFGTSAGSAITGSYTQSTHSHSAFVLSDSNGLAWGTNGSTVTGSYTQSTHTHAAQFSGGFSTNGNTSGDTGLVTGQLVLIGGNNVTLSGSTNAGSISVTISGPNVGGAQTGISGIQVSNTTYTSGTVTFQNANGISFGSSGANGISASYTVPTVTNSSWTASDNATSMTIGRLAFTNANGLTLTLSTTTGGSATLVGSYTQSTHTHATAAYSGSNASFTANTVTFGSSNGAHFYTTNGSMVVSYTVPTVPAQFSGGLSNIGNTVGDTGVVTGRVVFAGGNNITLSGSTNAGSATVTISAGAGGGAFTGGMSNVGNTAGTTGTVSAQMLVVGGPNITVSQSINGQSATLSISGNAPGAAAENNNFNLLGANTAGNTTASGSTIGLSGLNLTLSGTNNSQIVISAPATSSLIAESGISLSTNGSTITIRPTFESFFAYPPTMMSTATQTVAQSTSVVWPIEFRDLEAVSFFRIPATVSLSSMASIATAANNTKSYNQQGTFNWVMYSRGIGASSLSLQSVWSTSLSSRCSINMQQNANGSQWSVTHAYTFPNSAGTTSTSTSYATSLSNVNVSTTHLTFMSGMKFLAFPLTTTIQPDRYWMAFGFSTADTTSGNASLSNMRVTWSHLAAAQANSTWGEFGSANNASIQAQYGVGSFSTAGGGTTASIPLANISSSSSHNFPHITFARIA